MSVKHERIPRCWECNRFMVLKNTYEQGKIVVEEVYVYYCDNPKCGNNKKVEVLESRK